MYINTKGSEMLNLLAVIDPVNQAVGTVNSAWVHVANYHGLMAVIQTGVLGTGAILDVKLQQALDHTGTNTKDIPGKHLAQIKQATSGSNSQAIIHIKAEELDTINSYGWVRLSINVSGATGLIAAQFFGYIPRYIPASHTNQLTVSQMI